jgi:acetyl/propionyl-CoA carboxylase alpha subunit/acetyl-CoA carboxylase carboxyltransferase component
MKVKRLLVANRGEIAIRIMRAAAEMGIETAAIYSEDDAASLHTRKAGSAHPLRGIGARAYLNGEQIVQVAQAAGCDAIHPGYGFLSENAAFARLCGEHGIIFVGPPPDLLDLFGDKVEARLLAQRCGAPILRGSAGPVSFDQALVFLASLGEGGAMMIKAVAGGGGRGMRAVYDAGEIREAYERCASEARSAFGSGELYVEELMPRARHLEVQVIGDGSGAVSHLWERECSIQRRNQKIVEIAPSPSLGAAMRERLTRAAVKMASDVHYANLGTFEFLIDADKPNGAFAFIEANARLQVEHTVTEEVTGIDLVKTQLELASGKTLAELGLQQSAIPAPRGYAIQARINMESMGADGSVKPSGGTLRVFEAPSGPGIRVDSYAYAGYTTNPNFDSLLAKLIAYSPSGKFADAVARAYRALCEFKIEGVPTNIGFLQSLMRHQAFANSEIHTGFVEEHGSALTNDTVGHQRLFFERPEETQGGRKLAGAQIDASDPLAVLAHGKSAGGASVPPDTAAFGARPIALPEEIGGPEGTVAIKAPIQGTIISIDIAEGDEVHRGRQLFVMEAMKMEHVIKAPSSGTVRRVTVQVRDAVFEGHPLAFIEEADTQLAEADVRQVADLDYIRPDLAEVMERHELGLDAARPDMVERRRKTRQRTARENIADLCDPGTFVEYGPMVIAAQRRRRTIEDLIKRTPADGLVAGLGTVNGDRFEDAKARCVLMSYDYTVLAGTQGQLNHNKKDRLFLIAEKNRLPVIFFTEGGGGRPGDTDGIGIGLDCMAFHYWGRLSGLVPLIAINSGRCFAGNAALLGCADVVIAALNSNIGMGGPAMIEGGGLGIFRPEEVGPMSVQAPNGVVDIAVADEAEGVRAAKQYLSYFQGTLEHWEANDQRLLRSIIPENRLRIYDVREVIETLADKDSVLELRRHFGLGMVTSLVRIEGRPLGIIANNPSHLAGAIDSDGADKAARFIQLCDAFDIPLLFLCDTPGIMVGPEVEKTALVRHAARMFVNGASITVPCFTIILRKGYGLGAQAMAGGSFKTPMFTVSWPTGEFGGMGLEGAVKLGYRNELAAKEDPAERKQLFDEMVQRMYQHGKGLSTSMHFELDDVIDPADSRRWIMTGLKSSPPPLPRAGKKRPCIDTW